MEDWSARGFGEAAPGAVEQVQVLKFWSSSTVEVESGPLFCPAPKPDKRNLVFFVKEQERQDNPGIYSKVYRQLHNCIR
jgi:hypothetical protein